MIKSTPILQLPLRGFNVNVDQFRTEGRPQEEIWIVEDVARAINSDPACFSMILQDAIRAQADQVQGRPEACSPILGHLGDTEGMGKVSQALEREEPIDGALVFGPDHGTSHTDKMEKWLMYKGYTKYISDPDLIDNQDINFNDIAPVGIGAVLYSFSKADPSNPFCPSDLKYNGFIKELINSSPRCQIQLRMALHQNVVPMEATWLGQPPRMIAEMAFMARSDEEKEVEPAVMMRRIDEWIKAKAQENQLRLQEDDGLSTPPGSPDRQVVAQAGKELSKGLTSQSDHLQKTLQIEQERYAARVKDLKEGLVKAHDSNYVLNCRNHELSNANETYKSRADRERSGFIGLLVAVLSIGIMGGRNGW